MKTETFSYLPALNQEQLTRQIQYFLDNDWIPGIEFTARPGPTTSLWNWWKLPLFGARTPDEVLGEVAACRRANADCYIRITAYDRDRQGQVMAFVVHRPD